MKTVTESIAEFRDALKREDFAPPEEIVLDDQTYEQVLFENAYLTSAGPGLSLAPPWVRICGVKVRGDGRR
jgi:hypothetical protein